MEHGIDLEALKADQNMTDVDDFDFICHVAFDKKPLTRRERAENVKKRDFLSKYSGAARDVLEALLDKYMNTGIYEIEKTEILRLDPFLKMGKPQKIASYFGGKDVDITKRIGLTITGTCQMVPSKSVTAFIGIEND